MGSCGGLRGFSCKIDKDGVFSAYASGLRGCAGIAFSPSDELYYTDSQGEYMSSSKLFRLKKGAYYGHPSSNIDLAELSEAKAKSLEKGRIKERGEKEGGEEGWGGDGTS